MDKMTIFYNKENGRIMNISTGIQDFSLFDDTEKAMLMYKSLTTDLQESILREPRKYIVVADEIVNKETLP